MKERKKVTTLFFATAILDSFGQLHWLGFQNQRKKESIPTAVTSGVFIYVGTPMLSLLFK